MTGTEPVRPETAALHGHLQLVAAPDAQGGTVLAQQSFRTPFHIGKAYRGAAGLLQVQVVNSTAGILSGDRLKGDVTVRAGAALQLTTPAAARAFAMLGGRAECRQAFRVEAGGWLDYAPEPLYPHRDSEYTQRTVVALAAGAELWFADPLAPGRAGRGELWAWRRLGLRLELQRAGRPVLVERMDASGEEMARLARFHGGDEAWLATILAVAPGLDAAGPAWAAVRALHAGNLRVGVSRLEPGVWVMRLVASGGQALRDGLARCREELAAVLPRLDMRPRR